MILMRRYKNKATHFFTVQRHVRKGLKAGSK